MNSIKKMQNLTLNIATFADLGLKTLENISNILMDKTESVDLTCTLFPKLACYIYRLELSLS